MERTVTTSQILDVWEQARSQTHVQRALSLLALAVPTHSPAELARYSIGRRDWELFALRERLFGPRMVGSTGCPVCREAVEADFSVADIRAGFPPGVEQVHVLRSGDYELHFHLPTCGDLAELSPHDEKNSREAALTQRCLTGTFRGGAVVSPHELPLQVLDALSARMAELDPPGDIQLALNCPACGHHWQAALDIVSYLWSEIQAWAGRTLRDVHALASTYGWPESDILALTPGRRQIYLELIRS